MGAFFKNLFKNEFKEYEQEVARLQVENVELKSTTCEMVLVLLQVKSQAVIVTV